MIFNVSVLFNRYFLVFIFQLSRKQDWEEAIHWYDSVLNMTDYDEGGEFDGTQDEPRYLLLAREAEMYQEGGYNLTADPQKAGLTPHLQIPEYNSVILKNTAQESVF